MIIKLPEGLSMKDVRMHVNQLNLCHYQAKACSSAGIACIKNINRRTIDVLASRLYFYYSLSYELTGELAAIRGYVVVTATLKFFLQNLLTGSARY